MKPADCIKLVVLQVSSVQERLNCFDYNPNFSYHNVPLSESRSGVIRDCRAIRNELLRIIHDLEEGHV